MKVADFTSRAAKFDGGVLDEVKSIVAGPALAVHKWLRSSLAWS